MFSLCLYMIQNVIFVQLYCFCVTFCPKSNILQSTFSIIPTGGLVEPSAVSCNRFIACLHIAIIALPSVQTGLEYTDRSQAIWLTLSVCKRCILTECINICKEHWNPIAPISARRTHTNVFVVGIKFLFTFAKLEHYMTFYSTASHCQVLFLGMCKEWPHFHSPTCLCWESSSWKAGLWWPKANVLFNPLNSTDLWTGQDVHACN